MVRVIEHRKNYSSYNNARGQKGYIEYYTDKYGKQTDSERDYSGYNSGTTEEKSSDDIPIKNTSITPNDLRYALKISYLF
ncbi:MAG: hypothetical protein IKU78_07960 [Paludibacteraceae bacterium]|nr:hypothetical protein [Paludibacteraceae bacterium]